MLRCGLARIRTDGCADHGTASDPKGRGAVRAVGAQEGGRASRLNQARAERAGACYLPVIFSTTSAVRKRIIMSPAKVIPPA
jgi:hypothetical protein